MTTINRLNTTISDHNMAANFIALLTLTSVSIFSAAAITHSGNLAKSSYDTFLRSVPAVQVPVISASQQTTASTLTVSDSSPSSLQNQPKDVAAQLQSSPNTLQNSEGVETLQPAANTVQLTGNNLQHTVSIL